MAASELNVTQTAISHQIRRLEEELGIRLFVRQNRALALTPEARDYLPGIRAAFNDLRLATDRLLRKDNDHVLTVSHAGVAGRKVAAAAAFRVPGGPSRHRRPHHHLDRAWSISGAATSMPRSAMAAANGRACAPTG